MKLDKFTKVCINLVLILVIVLLVKFLITVPRNLYSSSKDLNMLQAQPRSHGEATVRKESDILIFAVDDVGNVQEAIDRAKEMGYKKLRDIDIEYTGYNGKYLAVFLIFER